MIPQTARKSKTKLANPRSLNLPNNYGGISKLKKTRHSTIASHQPRKINQALTKTLKHPIGRYGLVSTLLPIATGSLVSLVAGANWGFVAAIPVFLLTALYALAPNARLTRSLLSLPSRILNRIRNKPNLQKDLSEEAELPERRKFIKTAAMKTAGAATLIGTGSLDMRTILTPLGVTLSVPSRKDLVSAPLAKELEFDWAQQSTFVSQPITDQGFDQLMKVHHRQFLTTPLGTIALIHLKPKNWNGLRLTVHHGGPDHIQSSMDYIIAMAKLGVEVLGWDRFGPGYSTPNQTPDFILAEFAKLELEIPRMVGFGPHYKAMHSWAGRYVGEAICQYGRDEMGVIGLINIAGQIPAVSNAKQPYDIFDPVMNNRYNGAANQRVGFISAAPVVLSMMYDAFNSNPAEIAQRTEAYLRPVKQDAEVLGRMIDGRRMWALFQSTRLDSAITEFIDEIHSTRKADGSLATLEFVPLLNIFGSNDIVMRLPGGTSKDFADKLRQDFLASNPMNQAENIMIDGTGHYPQQEKVNQVAAESLAFMLADAQSKGLEIKLGKIRAA